MRIHSPANLNPNWFGNWAPCNPQLPWTDEQTSTQSFWGHVECWEDVVNFYFYVVLGGGSLDSLMAQAWTRQEARQLCGYATEQTTKWVLRTPKLLLRPQTLHHLTWIWAKLTITMFSDFQLILFSLFLRWPLLSYKYPLMSFLIIVWPFWSSLFIYHFRFLWIFLKSFISDFISDFLSHFIGYAF